MQGSRPQGSSSKSDSGKSDKKDGKDVEKSDESGIIKSKGQQEIQKAFKTAKTSTEIADTIINNHRALADYTPSSMKQMLENLGYDVKPLGGKSSLKGIPFENGGGYRVSFLGDGYFQYHPDKNSHHDKAYWKISNGERGDHRYDMEGNEK